MRAIHMESLARSLIDQVGGAHTPNIAGTADQP